MSIWAAEPDLDALNAMNQRALPGHLGIRVTEVGPDFLRAAMPVDERTVQPFGILHGGASVVLAETLGSLASTLCIDPATQYAVGVEVNANHLRPVKGGEVLGTVRAIQVGRGVHVWDIRIENTEKKPVCVSRLTVAVRPREDSHG